MILPDVNVLIYAYDESSKHHSQAKRWWEDQLNGSQLIGLSWVALLGFIRLLTNPRIYRNPYSPPEILAIVKTWLEQPHVKIIHPSEHHFTRLASLIEQVGTAANLTTDAHLAALAIERGLILQTTDADFARFAGLKWKNPLQN
ncbi:MAG TPA: type II toxin-antitoxin system VapC family toxin [Verrucomicrobiae bacterium]